VGLIKKKYSGSEAERFGPTLAAEHLAEEHEGRCLQLHPGQRHYGSTQSKALVCEWEEGVLELYYRSGWPLPS